MAKFLLAYRSAPHALTNETPAQLFLNRNLRTKLSLVQPDHEELVESKNEKISETHGGRKNKYLEIGQRVLCKNFAKADRGKPWIEGKILARPGSLTYVVELGPNKFVKRHFDQLIALNNSNNIPNNSGNTDIIQNDDCDVDIFGPTLQTDNTALRAPLANATSRVVNSPIVLEETDNSTGDDSNVIETNTDSSQEQQAPSRRYPTRERNLPSRLNDYDTTTI